KLGAKRYRGLDVQSEPPAPVVVVISPAAEPLAEPPLAEPPLAEPPLAEPLAEAIPVDDELVPEFDATPDHLADTVPFAKIVLPTTWPGPGWDKTLLQRVNLASLPRIIDNFNDDGIEYLVLEVPQGKCLWDAWDDADEARARFGWLKEVAEI